MGMQTSWRRSPNGTEHGESPCQGPPRSRGFDQHASPLIPFGSSVAGSSVAGPAPSEVRLDPAPQIRRQISPVGRRGRPASSSKLLALVRGWQVRAVLACPRVQTVLRQIRDTSAALEDMSNSGADPTSDPLWKPMEAQLRAQKSELHGMLFPQGAGIGQVFATEYARIHRAKEIMSNNRGADSKKPEKGRV